MSYYLTRQSALKWLETPAVYQIVKDELYELDNESFRFLRECATEGGCTTKDSAFIDYCVEEGLLTADKVSVRRPPLAKSPEPSLRYLELQITSACNLRCRHCYIDSSPGKHLSATQIRDVLEEFEKMQGLRVLITGGEPLLHGEFDEVNDMLPDFAFRKVLFTNGVLLKNGVLKKLKVQEIQVSIDGLEQAHDALRGTGTYERSMNAIKHALDAGFEVSVSTMVHAANLEDFDEMERKFKDMGIREWTVDVPCATGRLRENAEFQISPELGGKYLGYGYGGGMHTAGEGYGCGLHLMAVTPDGRAAKCTFFDNRAVGTIEEGLAACWQRIKPIRLETLSCDCEYLTVCRGGCRYRAETLGGHKGKDLYRCALYGILNKKNDS
jgi:radical SAM protein with 4Fe4S-binding SPASM domain